MIGQRHFISHTFLILFGILLIPGNAVFAQQNSYADLEAFFIEWRAFEAPPPVDGVPDYSPGAMAKQHRELPMYREKLAAIDTTGWPVPDRVDYILIWAELNGLDFEHRVRRPWANNPAFYNMVFLSQSDVPAREGPIIHGAIDVWQYPFPLSSEDAADLAGRIATIPELLSRAKENLIGNGRDLWLGGIGTMEGQVRALDILTQRIDGAHQYLQGAIEDAKNATIRFVEWLKKEAPGRNGPSGIGADNYTWFMKFVHLLPYSWEDEVTLVQRELARAHTSLRLEEHNNRNLPPLERIDDAATYDRLMNDAVTEFIEFLEREDILSVAAYMDPALRAKIGSFSPTDGLRNFFSEVNYRDPIVMRTHHYHWIELARIANDPNPRLIRRGPSLYNMYDARSEGFATGFEEMMMHAGLLNDKPRSRELIWILLAQRAARALSGLHLHSNDFTMKEAIAYASKWTPRGWLPERSDLVQGEQHLYLQQPGYGTSYVIGKIEIEHLIAERARRDPDGFSLKAFMDDFNAAGIIPVSLLHWELAGDSSRIQSILDDFE